MIPELTVLRIGRKARFQPANSFPLTWIPFCFRILTQRSPARDEENVQETVQGVSKGDNTSGRLGRTGPQITRQRSREDGTFEDPRIGKDLSGPGEV
jgi:hypothetical protein